MQELISIKDSFWYMTPVSRTDRPILGIVVGNEKNLMIDAGNSESHARFFLEKINKNGISNPDYVVLTHWHWDHIFGLSALKNVLSISSYETKKEMNKLISYKWTDEALDQRVKEGIEIEFCASCIKEEFGEQRSINVILPAITFDNILEINLGGITCVLKHIGGDHSKDSIVVYIKELKILFLGDIIYPDIFASKRNYTIKGTLELIEELEAFDAEIYIPSHCKPLNRDEFFKEIQMINIIECYTEKYKGDIFKIEIGLKEYLGRELNEEELETIEYFINGYDLQY